MFIKNDFGHSNGLRQEYADNYALVTFAINNYLLSENVTCFLSWISQSTENPIPTNVFSLVV